MTAIDVLCVENFWVEWRKKEGFRFHQAPAVKKVERRQKRKGGVGENFG